MIDYNPTQGHRHCLCTNVSDGFRDAAAHLCAHVLLRVVTTLAQPFAAHPDFDPEWSVPA